MRRTVVVLLVLVATCFSSGIAQTVDSVRTEAVRSRGFIRAAETQATKVIELLDSLEVAAGDTVIVQDTLPPVQDTLPPVQDTLPAHQDTLPPVQDTLAAPDTVRLEAYPVRPPLPEPIAGDEWGVTVLDSTTIRAEWAGACPVYSITGPEDPWAIEIAPGQYSAPSPCPPILQDAWLLYGGRAETEFERIYQSGVSNHAIGGLEAGDYWVCLNRLFGFRADRDEYYHGDGSGLIMSVQEVLDLPTVLAPEQSCKSFTLP